MSKADDTTKFVTFKWKNFKVQDKVHHAIIKNRSRCMTVSGKQNPSKTGIVWHYWKLHIAPILGAFLDVLDKIFLTNQQRVKNRYTAERSHILKLNVITTCSFLCSSSFWQVCSRLPLKHKLNIHLMTGCGFSDMKIGSIFICSYAEWYEHIQ